MNAWALVARLYRWVLFGLDAKTTDLFHKMNSATREVPQSFIDAIIRDECSYYFFYVEAFSSGFYYSLLCNHFDVESTAEKALGELLTETSTALFVPCFCQGTEAVFLYQDLGALFPARSGGTTGLDLRIVVHLPEKRALKAWVGNARLSAAAAWALALYAAFLFLHSEVHTAAILAISSRDLENGSFDAMYSIFKTALGGRGVGKLVNFIVGDSRASPKVCLASDWMERLRALRRYSLFADMTLKELQANERSFDRLSLDFLHSIDHQQLYTTILSLPFRKMLLGCSLFLGSDKRVLKAISLEKIWLITLLSYALGQPFPKKGVSKRTTGPPYAYEISAAVAD